jgi:hypothetical protein
MAYGGLIFRSPRMRERLKWPRDLAKHSIISNRAKTRAASEQHMAAARASDVHLRGCGGGKPGVNSRNPRFHAGRGKFVSARRNYRPASARGN